ncbi:MULTISPECIES: glycosyltransferase [Psychrobacter]|uniref:glycosyltransferase n=1 Tax=Psychrobacter TaxID=497 RepID=UPI001660CDA4|nr:MULTISPECIES: glycosyltransferase [Psychrobacter]
MSVIRILHIIGKMDRAGAETMLMNLYRNIDRDKFQFDFVVFTNDKGNYDDEILALGGRIIPIIANNPIGRMLKMTRFLKKHPEYKIVHAHMLLSNAFHLLAAKKAGIKHRISHSHSTSNGKNDVFKGVYERWALFTNRKLATYKIACGEQASNYLFGSTKEVMILPNAVDIDKINEVCRSNSDYISRNFGDNKLKIIQVGRLNEVKNYNFSLKIAEELKNSHIDFSCYIVGQGPLEQALKKEAKEKGLEDKVIFLGVRSDVVELMAGADVMIMPSLHEGFPVVLVESQASGLPSIVSDQVSDEVDLNLGLVTFLPITSPKDWANSLININKSLISKSELAQSLRVQGFDIKSNKEQLIDVYKKFEINKEFSS